MSSSASASSESDEVERYRKRRFGGYLSMTLQERRWRTYVHCEVYQLKYVRRWFVREFPPNIRERVMAFVDKGTAEPILQLELQIYHPELAKALKRPSAGQVPGQDFPSYYDIFFPHMRRQNDLLL